MTALDIVLLIALSAIWGASYLFIRVAGPAFGPFALIDVRVWLAGAALVPVALAARQMPDLRARWRDYLLLGAINAESRLTVRWQFMQTWVGGTTATGARSTVAWQ